MHKQLQHPGERDLWEVTVDGADGRIDKGSVLATKAEAEALRERLLEAMSGRRVTMTRGDVPTAYEFVLYSPLMCHDQPVFSIDAIVALAARAAEIATEAATDRDPSSLYEVEQLGRARALQQQVESTFDALFAKDDHGR